MGYQEIIAYGILIFAVAYMVKKAFWKNKKKNDSCGGGNCGCS